MHQDDGHAGGNYGSCRPCAARVRRRVVAGPAQNAGAGLVAVAGGHKQVHAGTCGKPSVPAPAEEAEARADGPSPVGSEAKSRGEERGSEKQRTLGSERGKESERESATFLSSNTRHQSSVPPRPSARRLAPRRWRVAPCARLAAGARAAPPVVVRAAEEGCRVAPHRALGRGGVAARVLKLGVGGVRRDRVGAAANVAAGARRASRPQRACAAGRPTAGRRRGGMAAASLAAPCRRRLAHGARCGASPRRARPPHRRPPPPRRNISRAVPRENRGQPNSAEEPDCSGQDGQNWVCVTPFSS